MPKNENMTKKQKHIAKSEKTPRGFLVANFEDRNGIKCSVQQSSAIGDTDDAFDRPGSSCLWLGVDDVEPMVMASQAREFGIKTAETTGWVPYPIPEDVLLHSRMHLSKEQVVNLINTLQHWVQTGKLPK